VMGGFMGRKGDGNPGVVSHVVPPAASHGCS
jgi:hypothetical protein